MELHESMLHAMLMIIAIYINKYICAKRLDYTIEKSLSTWYVVHKIMKRTFLGKMQHMQTSVLVLNKNGHL